MSRDEAISEAAAAIPSLLAAAGLVLVPVRAELAVRAVAGLLRLLISEDAPVVAVAERIERVDERAE